jgi:hypothetical protein
MGKRKKNKPRGKAFASGESHPRFNPTLHHQNDAKADANSLSALVEQATEETILVGDGSLTSSLRTGHYANSSISEFVGAGPKFSLRHVADRLKDDPEFQRELAELDCELRGLGIDPATGEPLNA